MTTAPAHDPFDAMTRIYDESRRTALAAPLPDVADYLLADAALADAQRIPLPAPRTEGVDVYQALIERTAIRFFDPASVGLDQLATLLHAAAAGDRHDWPDDAYGLLRLTIVAWRVADLPPAVYTYDAAAHALAFVADAPDPRAKDGGVNLVLQVEFAESPVIVLITGNLAAATARYGGWGHRQLLLRAGAAGQRLWLAAHGVGLVGTTFAGFLPRAAERIAGIDGYRSAGLLAFATGHLHPDYPAPDPSDPNI